MKDKALMREKILDAITLYVEEPQTRGYEIRAIPSPEVLVGFIMDAIREDV